MIYYLTANLTFRGEIYAKRTMNPLKAFPDKAKKNLLEQGLIRELITPPVIAFEPLKKYATILDKAGIETLGDFAFADLSLLRPRMIGAKEALIALQPKVLAMLDPNKPIPIEDDCGCVKDEPSIPKK